ncbi:hypothetical protein [Amycolatopsis thailandensis]|uniref:hypothetical protein n=1 Tax=Amycolatopsis thailandensis TaxID=589330 RepID=UPI00363EF393
MFGKKNTSQQAPEPGTSTPVYRLVTLSGTCVDCGTPKSVEMMASVGGCPSTHGPCTCGSAIPVVLQ